MCWVHCAQHPCGLWYQSCLSPGASSSVIIIWGGSHSEWIHLSTHSNWNDAKDQRKMDFRRWIPRWQSNWKTWIGYSTAGGLSPLYILKLEASVKILMCQHPPMVKMSITPMRPWKRGASSRDLCGHYTWQWCIILPIIFDAAMSPGSEAGIPGIICKPEEISTANEWRHLTYF